MGLLCCCSWLASTVVDNVLFWVWQRRGLLPKAFTLTTGAAPLHLYCPNILWHFLSRLLWWQQGWNSWILWGLGLFGPCFYYCIFWALLRHFYYWAFWALAVLDPILSMDAVSWKEKRTKKKGKTSGTYLRGIAADYPENKRRIKRRRSKKKEIWAKIPRNNESNSCTA